MSTGVSLARREQKQRKGQMCKAWFLSQVQNGLRQWFILPDCRHMAEAMKLCWYFQSLEIFISVAWCSLLSEVINTVVFNSWSLWCFSLPPTQLDEWSQWHLPVVLGNRRSGGREAADKGPVQCNIKDLHSWTQLALQLWELHRYLFGGKTD